MQIRSCTIIYYCSFKEVVSISIYFEISTSFPIHIKISVMSTGDKVAGFAFILL